MTEEITEPTEEFITKPSEKKYYDHISVAKRTSQVVYFVAQHDKTAMLDLLLKDNSTKQTIILTKSKKSADELYFHLKDVGFKALAIHGNHKPEVVIESAKAFNDGEINIIITTDMILQSLELKNIQTILNYDLPLEPMNYFKRQRLVDEVGETISLVSADEDKMLSTIELMMKIEVPEATLDGFEPTPFVQTYKPKKKKPRHKKAKAKKQNYRKDSTE